MSFLGLDLKDVRKFKRKGDIKGLIKALGYKKSSKVRQEAAIALGEARHVQAVDSLIAALNDEGAKVRMEAAIALGKIEDTRAINPLIEALTDKNVEKYALHALAKRIGAPAVDSLIDALRGKHPIKRENAALALGLMEVQNTATVLALLEAACDSNEKVAWRAQYALKEIGDEFIIKTVIEIGEPAVDILIKCIRRNGYDIFMLALKALRKIDIKRALAPLIDIIEDKNSDDLILNESALALGEIGEKEAVIPIVQLLKEKFPRFPSIGIVEGLDKLNWEPDKDDEKVLYWIIKKDPDKCIEIGESAREPLNKFLEYVINDKTRKPEVIDVIFALGKLDDARAFEIIHSSFKKENETEILRAAEVLDKIGISKEISKGIEVIIDALTERSYYKKTLFMALGILNWKPGLDEMGAEFCIATKKWDECEKMGDVAIEPLIDALNAGDLDAARTLGKMGDMRAVDPIIEILGDKEAFLRKRSHDKFNIFWRRDEAKDSDRVEYWKLRDKTTKMEEELEKFLINVLCDITDERFGQTIEWRQWWNKQKKI